jgi:hypothetical protein
VCVHDGAKPERHTTSCRHARCTIHHWRELTFVEELDHQPGATELTGLLLSMKAAVAQMRARGEPPWPAAARVICVYSYDGMDEADVMRLRNELRALGVSWPISYKLDSATLAGQYSRHGAWVSLYRI